MKFTYTDFTLNPTAPTIYDLKYKMNLRQLHNENRKKVAAHLVNQGKTNEQIKQIVIGASDAGINALRQEESKKHWDTPPPNPPVDPALYKSATKAGLSEQRLNASQTKALDEAHGGRAKTIEHIRKAIRLMKPQAILTDKDIEDTYLTTIDENVNSKTQELKKTEEVLDGIKEEDETVSVLKKPPRPLLITIALLLQNVPLYLLSLQVIFLNNISTSQ